ncbi:FtsX-like permease family protein [Cellulomonas sp.]|uniref:FtsX-like permease family protein n=1 Tax=Cellulomonas sp. TaxID=40001 RepID=UPI002810F21E|nr:FtsX-like permease family protein [Cellulomonas sp.]
MRALVALGLRFALSGGRLRSAAVVVGNAVAAALLLAAAALPAALHPAGDVVDPVERTNTAAVLAFSLVPAVVLVLTAARTSGAAHDRRAAALRLLGLTRTRTVVVAAVENGVLGLAGSLVGLALFLVVAPVADAAVAAGPEWFAATFAATPAAAALVVVATTGASALVAAGSTARSTRRPLADRAEGTPRVLSPWRLVPAALAVGAFVLVVEESGTAAWLRSDAGVLLLVAGAVVGAVAVAVVTPLLAAWCAGLLVRTRAVPAVLAGRAVQGEPAATGRLVSGVGVAVYLVLAALAVLAAYESTPQYRYALQTIRQGPQPVVVGHEWDGRGGRVAPVSDTELAALAAVPGVQAVVPRYTAEVEGWCSPQAPCAAEVFVGTCDDLAQLMVAEGCHDDRAAVVTVDRYEGTANGMPPVLPERASESSAQVRFGADGPVVTVPLREPVVQDSAATQERWVYQSSVAVFVPRSVAERAGAEPSSALVVADGGLAVQRALGDAAPPGLVVQPYPVHDYDAVQRVRVVVTTLSAIVIGAGLLSLAMVAVDRAVERRRAVARHVAVGVPPRVLRTAQLLQTLLPLVVAVTLAAALGSLMVRAYAALSGWPPLADSTQLGLVAAATLAGAVLVSLTTVPVVRARVTADLLRRE